jgi:hypothetical protein
MIFGHSDMMGVPWETMITSYSKRLDGRTFATLESYAKDFLSFVEKAKTLFSTENQTSCLSFLMRMAVDESETVAEPVDVAILSKREGFVWIKRKHLAPQTAYIATR